MNSATSSFILLPMLSFFLVSAAASSNVTALYVFGDSTVDPGNNNHFFTIARSDHAPYGKDFPNHVATGRFSNGKLITDFLASALGLKDVLPAYYDPKLSPNDIFTGISFASAGTGLDSLTATLASVLKMSTQLDNFDKVLGMLKAFVGQKRAEIIINNAIFFISIGTNDIIDSFYNLPTRRLQYSISGYHDFLLHELQNAIERLYSAGARRFAVAGLPPIGCLPVQVTIGSLIPGPRMLQRVCVDQQNTDSISYNNKLQDLISRLEANELKGAKLGYVELFYQGMDMIHYPARYGFEETLKGCCGLGFVEAGPLCSKNQHTCADASKYVFWDAIHPTQAAYGILARTILRTVIPHLLS